MKKHLVQILTLTAALLTLSACTASRPQASAPKPSMLAENTQGAYVVHSDNPYYRVIDHQLCANSAGQWYQLRSPQIDRGFVRGVPWVTAERWEAVGGSHVRTFYRTPGSFRNAAVEAVFIEE